MKKVLYIGWIGYKNLGDELMFDLFKEQFLKLGNSYTLEFVNIEHRYLKNISPQSYDLIIIGGGSILGGYEQYLHPYVIDFLHHALTLNKKIMIWGTGIDWVPKDFIDKLNGNEKIPVSISPNLQEKIERVFRESVWSGVRGPLTLKMLEQYGIKNNVLISGDPAFLLKHQPNTKENNLLTDSRLQHYEKIIGVNWGTSFNYIYGENEIKVEDELAAALNQLIEKGYLVYLFSVWKTDFVAIERLYTKLSNKRMVILDKTLRDQNELMTLINHFVFTINFKLHANYISLAANVPFVALGYRFKVFDFIKSLNFEDFIIATDEENIEKQLLIKETEIVKNRPDIITTMDFYQKLYRKKIKEPFEKKLYI